MSRFQQKPEGISAKGKSRIYITGHPKDVDDHFESISDEILKIRNVVFYRESEMDESETSDEDFRTLRESQFQEMNLIVFLVSRRFLSSECRSRLVEYDVAMEMKIPILPIVLDKYAAKDFGPVMNEMKKGYGNIQFVDRSSLYTDYIEKLKGSITSILLGEELTDQIRSAFDAQVFLSYRKKDITPCRELMRMIHRIPLCESIAIWYDNFLVGGEDWTDAIADAMESSQAVILAITEHITEKNEEGDDNYIVSTEYPMAQKRNKPILPIELFHFDESDLQRLFSDFPPVPIIDGRDEAAVKEAFKSYLTDVALTVNSKPEHNYWLGLAYLEGIGSERDPQHAISLLSKAVECDHLADAAERLSKIYWYGNGVSIDYDVSMEWKRKEIRILEEAYQSAENSRDLDAAERGEALYLSATNYADRYAAIEEYDRARKIYADIIPLARELFGKFGEKYCRGESFLYRKMADSYGEEQNYREAREKYLESLNFNRKVKETVHTANVTKGIFEDCIKLLYNACCLMDFEDARNWERLARQELDELQDKYGSKKCVKLHRTWALACGDACMNEQEELACTGNANHPSRRELMQKAYELYDGLVDGYEQDAFDQGDRVSIENLIMHYYKLFDIAIELEMDSAQKWYNKLAECYLSYTTFVKPEEFSTGLTTLYRGVVSKGLSAPFGKDFEYEKFYKIGAQYVDSYFGYIDMDQIQFEDLNGVLNAIDTWLNLAEFYEVNEPEKAYPYYEKAVWAADQLFGKMQNQLAYSWSLPSYYRRMLFAYRTEGYDQGEAWYRKITEKFGARIDLLTFDDITYISDPTSNIFQDMAEVATAAGKTLDAEHWQYRSRKYQEDYHKKYD